MKPRFRAFFRLIFRGSALLALISPASAIIVSGTSGTGFNNAGKAPLQAYLSGASLPAFTHWDSLVRVTDASGVYLGYNPSTLNGWVLSAEHITPEPATISVLGTPYTVIGSGIQVGTTDLILYEISGPLMPGLAVVPLASGGAPAGEFLIMTGRGYTTSTTAPFPWGTPGATDAIPMRWGTNVVEGTGVAGGNTYIFTDFDEVSSPGVTAYEGQGAVGDSGGGIFAYRGGQWVLAGIAHFVYDDGGPVDPSEYGDLTAYTDIGTYLPQINAITGTLVPEPSALLAALWGGGLLLARRRRG